MFRAGDGETSSSSCAAGRCAWSCLAGQAGHHLATFGPGESFGRSRSTGRAHGRRCGAQERTLRRFRGRFEEAADAHPKLARQVFSDLARQLALRLRQADAELGALKEG